MSLKLSWNHRSTHIRTRLGGCWNVTRSEQLSSIRNLQKPAWIHDSRDSQMSTLLSYGKSSTWNLLSIKNGFTTIPQSTLFDCFSHSSASSSLAILGGTFSLCGFPSFRITLFHQHFFLERISRTFLHLSLVDYSFGLPSNTSHTDFSFTWTLLLSGATSITLWLMVFITCLLWIPIDSYSLLSSQYSLSRSYTRSRRSFPSHSLELSLLVDFLDSLLTTLVTISFIMELSATRSAISSRCDRGTSVITTRVRTRTMESAPLFGISSLEHRSKSRLL